MSDGEWRVRKNEIVPAGGVLEGRTSGRGLHTARSAVENGCSAGDQSGLGLGKVGFGEESKQARISTNGNKEPSAEEKTNGKALGPPDGCFQGLADWSVYPRLLTIQEVSFLLRVPVSTLYKWNASGEFEGVSKRIGKQLRFDRDALMRMWCSE